MSGLPPASEVKRIATPRGAMLYDASRAGKCEAVWFDPAWWRRRGAVIGEAGGRGRTLLVRHGRRELVLRHYRRGGLIARLVADRYFFSGEAATRPFAEWLLTWRLHRARLPVPAPVAARYERHGPWYCGDLITERIADSASLAQHLARAPLPIQAWIAIGRCIGRFHAAGVCHADLNAHNILLDAAGAVYLIDFDRGSLRRPGLWADGNLVRLYRSLDKITDVLPPARVTETDWHSLLAGYREGIARRRSLTPGPLPPQAGEEGAEGG